MIRLSQRYVWNFSVLVALLFPFCLKADVLVVTGTKNASITLNQNQIRDVYLGRVSSLPDGRNVVLIDQPESSPLRDEFYLRFTKKSASQAKAQWAKLYFTGVGVPPREGANSKDIKKILNSTPGSIGYIERSELDNTVNLINVAQ